MKRIYHKLMWKLHRIFAGGCLVIIKPTMKCNLDCSYCSNVIATGKRVEYDEEVEPEDWIKWLNRFPTKIQVVSVSGGEPQTYPKINELLQLLIDNGYWVRMLTNMTKTNVNIKPNKRFCIQTSYHMQVSKYKFLANLDHYKDYNIIMKKEFTTNDIPGSKKYEIIPENCIQNVQESKRKYKWFPSLHIKFTVAPNLTLFTSCYECNVGKVLK